MLALWHAMQLLSVNTFLISVLEQLDGTAATELVATDEELTARDDELAITADELTPTDDTGTGGSDDELTSGTEAAVDDEGLSGASGSPEHAVRPINSKAIKYLYMQIPIAINYFFHKLWY